MNVDVDAVIFELYGLKPADFTAARDAYVARARREKDTAAVAAIRGLRKPTLGVWAANLLARTHPDQAEALLRLGTELRRAHRELDGERMRALSHEQHGVIGALAGEAGELAAGAGERLSETVLGELAGLFHGLLADEDAARRWAAGNLAKAPTAGVGFDGLEPAPGVAPSPAAPAAPVVPAPPPAAPAPRRKAAVPARPAADDEARAARRAAEKEAADASVALRRAEEGLTEAASARHRAEADAADLRDELATLQQRAEEARRTAREAKQLHRQAEQAHAKAARAAEKTARRLEQLDRNKD
ncbi:hypothetical protein ACGFZK_37050 [Streptomyces sp. NPDC048257]|uniref:hypothetical protein n=1 Tax=Streptomyces sp. NPDC048257 TaxID=3365526 RepID=UPI00371BB0A7